jgi:hypothetical protein
MRLSTLGIIVIGIGLVTIFSAIVSYAAWQKEYASMSEVLAHYNKTHVLEDCRSHLYVCPILALPNYDTTITVRMVMGTILAAGGGVVVIYGLRKEDKVKV